MSSPAESIAAICVTALRHGNTILFIGNGGSAADAQHLAAELIGKLNFDRPPLAALALTTDTSILTAIGNDYGFEHVFSRQIEALGKLGDVLIAISTSGNSKNILKAIEAAKTMGIKVIGMTGGHSSDCAMLGMCDFLYQAAWTDTQTIQEQHIKVGHAFCALIESEMFPQ